DERLLAEPGAEVGLELSGLQQEPGAEPPHVAVADRAAVVELQHRTDMRSPARLSQQAAGHPQVDQERAAGGEADDQVLAAPVDVLDALAGELCGDHER